ncbi:MAG: hypothetical protein ABWY33_02780 [Cellulomonas sp.]
MDAGRVGGIKGGVRRPATAAVAVLIAMLAVLLLAAPAGSAATGPADAGRAAVASAVQASHEIPGASDRLDALPPLRSHFIRAARARHRSGGHPLPAVLGRAAMFLLPACAFLLVHRCARATQAPPGRLAMSYPMRT